MNLLRDTLRDAGAADNIALVGTDRSLTRDELLRAAEDLAATLHGRHLQSIALLADNGIDWIVADLACQFAGIRLTPLPLFFAPAQIAHAVKTCGADALVSGLAHQPLVQAALPGIVSSEPLNALTHLYLIDKAGQAEAALPRGTQKITFTSGTTGSPKGVCLSVEQQLAVAQAIAQTMQVGTGRHLCVLPLSTLLENVAGVYAPLLAGGVVVVPPLAELGLAGSSGLDVMTLAGSISRQRPESLILVPEMLKALTAAAAAGWCPPSSLAFVAVGGGKVSAELVERAREAGLPAFEGYGLSECGSVVCLNVAGADRPGAVGKPLPHVSISIDHGEIIVANNAFLGYAGAPDSWHQRVTRTGDRGRIDGDGFVHIEGRISNRIITSFGRNLSPEWVESELLAGPVLSQAVVYGEARPYCVALVWPRDTAISDAEIDRWIASCNERLPDYARVLDWSRLPRPLNAAEGTATDNGRPKRDRIGRQFHAIIDDLYTNLREAHCQ